MDQHLALAGFGGASRHLLRAACAVVADHAAFARTAFALAEGAAPRPSRSNFSTTAWSFYPAKELDWPSTRMTGADVTTVLSTPTPRFLYQAKTAPPSGRGLHPRMRPARQNWTELEARCAARWSRTSQPCCIQRRSALQDNQLGRRGGTPAVAGREPGEIPHAALTSR